MEKELIAKLASELYTRTRELTKLQKIVDALKLTLEALGEEIDDVANIRPTARPNIGTPKGNVFQVDSVLYDIYELIEEINKPLSAKEIEEGLRAVKGRVVNKTSMITGLYRAVKKKRGFYNPESGRFGLRAWIRRK